jgi:hypothetical protein
MPSNQPMAAMTNATTDPIYPESITKDLVELRSIYRYIKRKYDGFDDLIITAKANNDPDESDDYEVEATGVDHEDVQELLDSDPDDYDLSQWHDTLSDFIIRFCEDIVDHFHGGLAWEEIVVITINSAGINDEPTVLLARKVARIKYELLTKNL